MFVQIETSSAVLVVSRGRIFPSLALTTKSVRWLLLFSQCGKEIRRRGVKHHLEDDCEYTEVACKYARIGCEAKIARKEMSCHVCDESDHHLHMALQNTAK